MVADRRGGALRVIRWAVENDVEVVALAKEGEDSALWHESAAFVAFVPARDDGDWPRAQDVVAAFHDSGSDALHPGWGAAVRDPRLVEQLSYSGVAWAGPSREALGLALDRAISLLRATGRGTPVVPSSGPLSDLHGARSWIGRVGFPVRIRPVDVEVGHPRPVMRNWADFDELLPSWLEHGPLVLEREVQGAREIEVPVLVDYHGNAVAIGDRDVTLRDGRRHLLVEAPAPGLSDAVRHRLADAAEAFARDVGWTGLGVVRFLVAPDGRPYLLQLRPGLQPWHGATEVAYDVDLVDAQLRLAMRDPLRWTREQIVPTCAAVWAQLVAAEPAPVVRSFRSGLRVDPEVVPGELVDARTVLGGVTAAAPTRHAAIVRLRAWLDAEPLHGVAIDRLALDGFVGAPEWWRGPLNRDRAAELLAPLGVPNR